jgi:hypothetical protein
MLNLVFENPCSAGSDARRDAAAVQRDLGDVVVERSG